MFNGQEIVGKTVTFMYDDKVRVVLVEKVNNCKNGSTMIVGQYEDGQYRSFNINRVLDLTIS